MLKRDIEEQFFDEADMNTMYAFVDGELEAVVIPDDKEGEQDVCDAQT